MRWAKRADIKKLEDEKPAVRKLESERTRGKIAMPKRAPPVELVQYVLAVAHEARRLLHRLAVLCLLAKLALVGRNSRNSSMLQFFEDAWLIP